MKFYGDNTRWFLGKVVDWKPTPETAGKVKVRIMGIHSEDVPFEDLPYAKCMLPTTEGGTSGIGKIPQVLNNAFVFGVFLDGQLSQSPIILGSMSHFETPSDAQIKEVEKTGQAELLASQNVVNGIIIDPNLRSMYNDGSADIDTRKVIIMQFLIGEGLSPVSAAGVCGNLIKESKLDPKARYTTASEDSYGLAQWNERVKRWTPLNNFAISQNNIWTDFFIQLQFLVKDMKENSVHRCWSHLSNTFKITTFEKGGLTDDSREARLTNATEYFKNKFLVADDNTDDREGYAREAYDIYFESLRKTAQSKTQNYNVNKAGPR